MCLWSPAVVSRSSLGRPVRWYSSKQTDHRPGLSNPFGFPIPRITDRRTVGIFASKGGFAAGDFGVSPDRVLTGWAVLSLSIGNIITTRASLLSWRPIFWTHAPPLRSRGRRNRSVASALDEPP
jgi:hypothetical protein